MHFLGPLVRNIALALLLASVLAWRLGAAVYPFTPEQLAALRLAFLGSYLAEVTLLVSVLAWLTRPLRRAARPGVELTSLELRRVAVGAHRVHALAAAAACLIGTAAGAARAMVMIRTALPVDVALAQAGMGLAATILGGMATYALCAAAVGPALERLGPSVELGLRGSVRGKIMLVCFGLNTIGLLLFATTGYVRYRADIDAEYVASARRAQEGVVRDLPAEPDPAVVQHVWQLTAASTVLLGSHGEQRARIGPESVPWLLAGDQPGTVRLADGWLVSARAPGGLVVSWIPEAPLRERRQAYWFSLVTTSFFVYLATAVMAIVAARSITRPLRSLGRAAGRIAAGNLTSPLTISSRDEVGVLAADFSRMAEGLKVLVVDVQSASDGVSIGAREAGSIGERVRQGAQEQHDGVVAVQEAVEAMEGSMAMVSTGVSGVIEYVTATTTTVGEMAAGLEEVRRKGSELDRSMDSALTDVDQLAAAGREAEAALGELEEVALSATGRLAAVESSILALERAAGESLTNAGLVAEMAERSGDVVEETVQGIETLHAAVSDAHRRVEALGRRSDDIDQVVDFISEVAGRTNLLSLNASIIASQAGEHGKAFAVVADQIRDLAAQIARSTKSIGDIIHAVREDVEATAALIDRGDALAVEGVQLARNSLEALGQIQRTTVAGRQSATAIRAAVGVHAGSSREMARLVESVAAGSRAVTGAVQLVGRSVAAVGSVSRNVDSLADQVSRSLEEQSVQGRRQMENLARLERMVSEATRAVEAHNAATRRVRETLGTLSGLTTNQENAVDGLSGVADRLGKRSSELADRVGRFRV